MRFTHKSLCNTIQATVQICVIQFLAKEICVMGFVMAFSAHAMIMGKVYHSPPVQYIYIFFFLSGN